MEFPDVTREQLYAPEIDEKYGAYQAKVAYHLEVNDDGSLRVPDPYFVPILRAEQIALEDSAFSVYQEWKRRGFALYEQRDMMNWMNLSMRQVKDHVQLNFYRLSKHDRLYFPRGFETAGSWLGLAKNIPGDPATQQRMEETTEWNVQTNFFDRGLTVKLASLLLGYAHQDIRMIAAGCSRTLMEQKLAFSKRRSHPYPYTDIMIPDNEGRPAAPDLIASRYVYSALNNNNLSVQSILATDIQDPMLGRTTKEAIMRKKWVRHCLYPSETELGWELDMVEDMRRPEVTFIQADITDLTQNDAHGRLEAARPDGKKADIAYLWTVGYQLREDGTWAAFKELEQHMQPEGKILLFDYVDVDEGGALHYAEDWGPYTCKGYVLDLAEREKGLQLLFTIDSGRVRKLMFSHYAGQLAVRQNMANLLPGGRPSGL